MGKFFKEREEGVYLYAHWIAHYPWLILLVTLSISALLIGLAFRTPFVLDSGGAGFVPRTDELGIRKDSLVGAAALLVLLFCLVVLLFCPFFLFVCC